MIKPRCEDIGFQHLWEDLTSQTTRFGEPPAEERRCVNCGRVERYVCVRPAVKGVWEWWEMPDANG